MKIKVANPCSIDVYIARRIVGRKAVGKLMVGSDFIEFKAKFAKIILYLIRSLKP